MIPQRRSRWQATIRSVFAERLALKAAALFFALVLWTVVSVEEPTEEIIPIRFAPMVDSGVVIVGQLPTVRALILGRGRELLKLYNASPVIVRRIQATSSETLTLELGPADVDLPAGVSAVVRDVRPRHVTLQLRRVEAAAAPAVAPAPHDSVAAGDTTTSGDSVRAVPAPVRGDTATTTGKHAS